LAGLTQTSSLARFQTSPAVRNTERRVEKLHKSYLGYDGLQYTTFLCIGCVNILATAPTGAV